MKNSWQHGISDWFNNVGSHNGDSDANATISEVKPFTLENSCWFCKDEYICVEENPIEKDTHALGEIYHLHLFFLERSRKNPPVGSRMFSVAVDAIRRSLRDKLHP